jgi:Sec-independent protein translocase protein TatA
MKVFNVGALEFAFILLLALIVLGPKKAVKAAGDMGVWIRKLFNSQLWKDLRSASKEIQDLPKKMMDEAEIQKTLAEIDRSTKDLNAAVREINQGLIENMDSSEQRIEPPDRQSQSMDEDSSPNL